MHSPETLAAWRAIINEILGEDAQGVTALDWWTDEPRTAGDACLQLLGAFEWMDDAFVAATAVMLRDDIKKELPAWMGFGLRYRCPFGCTGGVRKRSAYVEFMKQPKAAISSNRRESRAD